MSKESRRASLARYDEKRGPAIQFRLPAALLARLDAARQPGESRNKAAARLVREALEKRWPTGA